MNSGKDRGQFGGLGLQLADSFGREQGAFFSQFKPQERFVRFFQNSADLVDPISLASRSARSPVTRGDSGCRPHDLVRNDLALRVSRQGIGHGHNSQSELFGSGLQLFSIHAQICCNWAFAWKKNREF